MLGIQMFLISLIGLVTIFSKSGGYLMDRSAAHSLWNLPSSLSSSQNASYEKILRNNTRVIKMEKMSDEKMDVKCLEGAALIENPRKKRFETGSENVEEIFMMGPNDTSFKTNSRSSHLKNVILIFVDIVKQEREEFWTNFKRFYAFPVHNYLKVENDDENGPMKIDLNELLFLGSKEDECKCKETLRSDINELLIWARRVHGMTTSVLSAVNFSIPAAHDIEEVFEVVKNNESGETSTKGTIRKRQLQQRDLTRLMDAYESNTPDSPVIITSNAKKENVENYDDMWNVIDMFTKIRIAFFRAMIDSLGVSSKRRVDDEPSFQELPHLRTAFVSLVDDALKKLETASGDEGYLLVLVTSENELGSVIDLLHHQVSLSDTLLVVSEVCSKDIKRVSFFAAGPESSIFNRMSTIGELADVTKSVVGRAFQVRGCNKSRHRRAHGIPIRIIRDAIDSQNMTAFVNNSTENKPGNISNRIYDDLTGRMDAPSSSNAASNNLTTLLGMATSLLALITVNSSQ